MKKPLTLIPPAQAEALYDATLHDVRRVAGSTPWFSDVPPHAWNAWDWDEEEAPPASDTQSPGAARNSVPTHD